DVVGGEIAQLEDVEQQAALVAADQRLVGFAFALLDQLLDGMAQGGFAVTAAAQAAQPVLQALQGGEIVVRPVAGRSCRSWFAHRLVFSQLPLARAPAPGARRRRAAPPACRDRRRPDPPAP